MKELQLLAEALEKGIVNKIYSNLEIKSIQLTLDELAKVLQEFEAAQKEAETKPVEKKK